MDEFRRPFEYEDEKRGLLLLFIILIIAIDGSITVALTLQVYDVFLSVPAVGIGFIALGAIFFMFILYTAIACYKLKDGSGKVAKTYLVIRALFTLVCIITVYIHNLGDESLIGNGPQQFRSVAELTSIGLIYPAAYTLIFSAIWFLYFSKSKRFNKQTLKTESA